METKKKTPLWAKILIVVGILIAIGRLSKNTPQIIDVDTSAVSTAPKLRELFQLSLFLSKTPQEVELLLGTPTQTEKITGYPCQRSRCEKKYYKNGKYEVIFKNNKTSRITINNFPDLTHTPDALQVLGMKPTPPTFQNPDITIRWEKHEGIHEIAFFPTYVLIQINEPD